MTKFLLTMAIGCFAALAQAGGFPALDVSGMKAAAGAAASDAVEEKVNDTVQETTEKVVDETVEEGKDVVSKTLDSSQTEAATSGDQH